MDIQGAIDTMSRYGHLNAEQAESVMRQIMTGGATEAQIGAYLMALRIKGETTDEITGSARAMREAATIVPTSVTGDMLDTCGTGGDRSGTFNISTTVAFVAAGAGIPVAKHGNRAATSKSGSADVLAALGLNLELEPQQVGRCIDEIGIGFLFAVKLHPAMRHAIAPRRQLGIRTIFNILGPLTNPAGAQRFLMGVFAAELTDLLANVLRALGVKSAMVVNGYGGLDELTITGPNRISYLKEDGSITHLDADPTDYGFHRASLDELKGGEPAENAAILRSVLDGSDTGPKRDIVILNAGAAIMAAGHAHSIADGIVVARDSLESGRALGKLDQLIAFSQSFA
ncbi:MAG: anthranilate phosphoribosyltransferase [Chloroflexota bacterium]|nr:anthranilate phosphoribosyltransferase [Chloroflexota bacterium]